MGKTTKIISDFSGKEIDSELYFGLTVTDFNAKCSAKFFISQAEFDTLKSEHELKPEWESWNRR